MAIAMLSHPFCAGQVTVKCTSGAIMFPFGIDMEHQLCHLAPIRALRVSIQHAQISGDMLFVVYGEHLACRCNVGDVRIRGRFSHRLASLASITP